MDDGVCWVGQLVKVASKASKGIFVIRGLVYTKTTS